MITKPVGRPAGFISTLLRFLVTDLHMKNYTPSINLCEPGRFAIKAFLLLISVLAGVHLPVHAQTFSDFSPKSGSTGTLVTLTNVGFVGVTAVAFNGTNASFFSPAASVVQTQVPAGATTGYITVSTSTSTYTSDSVFTVALPLPLVQSFTPTFGLGGTLVSISGQNFSSATQVLFNGMAAASFTINSNNSIVATAPTGVTTGRITVISPLGRDSSQARFRASATPLPSIQSFTPTQGLAGSTQMKIIGSDFQVGPRIGSITINGTFVNTFFVTSNTEINLVVPLGTTTGLIRIINISSDTVVSDDPFVVTGQDLGFCDDGTARQDTVIVPTTSIQTAALDSGRVTIFKIKPQRVGDIYSLSSCGSAADVKLVVLSRGDSLASSSGNGLLCPTNSRNGSLYHRARFLDTVYVTASSYTCTPLSKRGIFSYRLRSAARIRSITPDYGKVGDVVMARGTGLDLIDSLVSPRFKLLSRTDTTLELEITAATISGNISYQSVGSVISTAIYFEVCQNVKPRISTMPTGSLICGNDTRQLTSTSAERYRWSNGDTNRTTSIRGGGRYWVTVFFNNCGFTSDTLTINQLPTPDVNLVQRNDSLIANPDNIVYTWFRNGVLIQSVSTNVLKLTALGSYAAVGRVGTCTDTAVFVVTNYDRDWKITGLQLYPNPAAQTVHLNSPADMNLVMYNSHATVVKNVSVHTGLQNLNIQELTPGVYFLKNRVNNQVWRLVVLRE